MSQDANTFRKFKRHYHKVRKVYQRLSEIGSFGLRIFSDENSLHGETRTPDDKNTVQFVNLMRPFLNPLDSLYYRRVWALIEEEFRGDIPNETIEKVESLIKQLSTGILGLGVNGEVLSTEKIYQIISEAGYFDYKEETQKYLESIADAPLVGPLFWFQFYSYTQFAFHFSSVLFDLITIARKSEQKKVTRTSISPINKCIYCLTTSGSFTSEEHIFPESLGNDEFVLPKGYVCDECNNQTLAMLDDALLKFEPIAFLAVQFVPFTKSGKLPKADFENFTMERTAPRHIVFKAKDKIGQPTNRKELDGGWTSFTIESKVRNFDPKLLGRSLHKIGLGMIALSQGHDRACNVRYDTTRAFILKGTNFQNNLLMQTVGKPHPQVQLMFHDLSEGTPFIINVYGLLFITNLEERPMIELNDELIRENFALHALHN